MQQRFKLLFHFWRLLHSCLFECDTQLDWIGGGYINEVRELIKVCKNGGATLSDVLVMVFKELFCIP